MEASVIACAILALVGGDPKSTEARLPPLNAAVLQFCQEHNSEQVGNGACSAVAEAALASAGAKTRGFDPAKDENGSPIWGERIDRAEDVLPGDVIQFHKVRLLDVRPSGARYLRLYPEHTAIVARVRGGGVFDLYEQNVITASSGKKRRGQLRIRDTDFRAMLEGTVTAYRPMPREASLPPAND